MKINQAFYNFIFDYKTKYWILKGGSGSSKSYSITQKLIIKGLQHKRRMLVLRKTGVTLSDSVIHLFKTILEENDIPYTYRASDRTLLFGESIVLFRCIDDPERIKSISGITDCWLEEATEFTPDDFTQLVLRLRDPEVDTQYILSFNPVAKTNWVYRYFFDPSSEEYYLEGRDYKIHNSTYRDNAFLNPSYVSDLLALRKSNPLYFTIYAEGEWGTLGKLIFPASSYTIADIEVPVSAKYIDGLDLGWNDPNGLACSRFWYNDGVPTLYTYKTWSKSECTTDTIAKVLKEFCRGRVVYGDNAAAAQIAEIQKNGYYNLRPNHKPPGSVLANINTIRSMKWYISPECTDLIRELGIYVWKKDPKTGLYLEEPERGSGDSHVNVIDGVRYSLEGIDAEVKQIKVHMPKGI